MSSVSAALNLPPKAYRQLEQTAQQTNRSVQEVLNDDVQAVDALVSAMSYEKHATLRQMVHLSDAALWHAARLGIPEDQSIRREMLHHKGQRTELTEDEQTEEEQLTRHYQHVVLIRAQAAVLLKDRHYDVADPSKFAS